MLLPRLSAAARGLLEWSQGVAAQKTGVNPRTIWAYESGKSLLKPETEERLRATYEANGIVFTDENGPKPGVFINLDHIQIAPVEAPKVEGDSQEGTAQ